MKNATHTLTIDAPKLRVFEFISRVENLPKWATVFARDVRRDGEGRWKVATPQGEILFRIEADAGSGVIDMYGGPDERSLNYWPARVVASPDGGSVFIFTGFQYPGMSDEEFRNAGEGLERELPILKRLAEAA